MDQVSYYLFECLFKYYLSQPVLVAQGDGGVVQECGASASVNFQDGTAVV